MIRNVRHLRPEDLRGLRWRGYVRESTAEQADNWSPERQRSDIARAADELGLVGVDPLWYERTGSGEKASPELARALADAKAGAFDVLAVYTTSRFARNRTEAVRVKGLFRTAGVPIYFVMERMISGSRGSGLLEGVKEVVDEEENETRRHWIAGGMRERMLSGRWLGAIPYGYAKVLVDFPDGSRGWDGGLEPDPDRAPILRRLFADFATGMSPLDIAFRLNAEGVPGPEGTWVRAGVHRMLRNPIYKGVYVRYRNKRAAQHYYIESDPTDGRREIATVSIAPLIPEAEWDQAQALLSQRISGGHAAPKHRPYPLSLVLRCGECGRPMSGMSNGFSRYYRCSSRGGDGSCRAPYIRADEAEGRFTEMLGEIALPSDWRAAIAGTHEPDTGAEDRSSRLTDRLARLRKLYAWGEMPEEEYRAEVTRTRQELAEHAQPSSTNMEELAERLRDLATWSNAKPEQQAAIARLMCREITVRESRVTTFVYRAEVRPLVELVLPKRVATDASLIADNPHDTGIGFRWSA